MSVPKPPFHTITEELLYGILQKLPDVQYLTVDDINTIDKLNAIIIDGDFVTSSNVASSILGIKGNVPPAGDTLEKIYNIISGLGNLKSEDIDTLAELNAVLTDASLVSTVDLATALQNIWSTSGNAFGEERKFGTTDDFSVIFITNNVERARLVSSGQFIVGSSNLLSGYEQYNVQIRSDKALASSGDVHFQDGLFSIDLGMQGSGIANKFRINSYVSSLGGFELTLSANNPNASIEIIDASFGGTRPEMIRLTPAGYADTCMLIKPNNVYNTAFGYRYLLDGTNNGQQGRNVAAFHGQINWSTDDGFPGYNQAYIFSADASVTNHRIDGFFASVFSPNASADVYAFRSIGSRSFLDGNGMTHFLPVLKITTDDEIHSTAVNDLMNGDAVESSALMLSPRGLGRVGLIISPAHANAQGLFIGTQQSLNTGHYDGYLAWIQFSTGGINMTGGTDKAMLLIRKHNASLNGFDHLGPFIRLEENIGSTGAFFEAYKYDEEIGSLRLKFSIDKDGVVSIGKLFGDAPAVPGVGRLYFLGDDLKLVTPTGYVKTVTAT